MTKWMPILGDGPVSLYVALADAIERGVRDGTLSPGDKLPTHRDLADELNVNVSTVTRGYGEAEKRGLVSGTVGRGTFIASDASTSTAMVSFEPCSPGMVELGLVEPLFCLDPDLMDGFKKLARRKDLSALMRYTDPRGLPEHRAVGARWAARFGMDVSAEQVLVCAGAQHALTCSLTALLRPGDRLATDRLTYPGLKTLATMLGLRLTPIDMDDGGMVPEALDTACRRDRIKGLYLMPSVQNPTTTCLSRERRERLATLIREHDLTVIEDDAYALTRPAEPDAAFPVPVSALVPDRSVLVAGLSKSLAAGLRVGFMVAPQDAVEPLARAVLNTIWMAPGLNAELACMWIKDGTADRVVEAKRAESVRRHRLMQTMLSGCECAGHPSGYFSWLSLPQGWSGNRFEAAARAEGVSVFGAERFIVGEAAAPAAVRVSLTGPANLAELEQGLGVLARLLRRGPR